MHYFTHEEKAVINSVISEIFNSYSPWLCSHHRWYFAIQQIQASGTNNLITVLMIVTNKTFKTHYTDVANDIQQKTSVFGCFHLFPYYKHIWTWVCTNTAVLMSTRPSDLHVMGRCDNACKFSNWVIRNGNPNIWLNTKQWQSGRVEVNSWLMSTGLV